MDNLDILKEVVDIRDKSEDEAYNGIFLEGFIGIFIILISILTLYYNLFVLNAILVLLLTTLYGVVMQKRLRSMRKHRRVQKFVKEVNNGIRNK